MVLPDGGLERSQQNFSDLNRTVHRTSNYALSLWALGFAGAAHNGAAGHWTDVLDGLRDIDWKKTNPDWQGICMAGNEVVTRVPTRRAAANYIKWKLGLETERPEPVITN